MFEGARDRVRRLRRLSPSDQRSLARHRRELHPGDPRLGRARLAGLGGGGQHAAARRAPAARHHEPADAWRRAAVGNIRQPLDPQRLARKRGGRGAGVAADRRHDPHRPQRGRCDALVGEEEIARRKAEAPPPVPESNTPWEELYREKTGQLSTGACWSSRSNIAARQRKMPRHNH